MGANRMEKVKRVRRLGGAVESGAGIVNESV